MDTVAGAIDKKDSVRLVSCRGEAAQCEKTGSGSGSESQYHAAGAGRSGYGRAYCDQPDYGTDGDWGKRGAGGDESDACRRNYSKILWVCCRTRIYKRTGIRVIEKERWIDGWNVDTMPGCVEKLWQPKGAAGTFSAVGEREDCGASGTERFR